VEGSFECCAPSDQHVVVAGAKRSSRSQPDQLAQAAAHPIALHGIADLLTDGEANPWRTDASPGPCLQGKGAGMGSRALLRALPGSLGDGPKVTSAFQPLHCSDFGVTGSRESLQAICNRIPSLARSGTQSFAAPCAASGQDLAAALAGHTRAKAMAALAYKFARLVGPFHEIVSAAPLTAAISRRGCGGL